MANPLSHVRHNATFPSGDGRCAAWLYRPDGVENPPVIVLAHGFGAFRELRLDAPTLVQVARRDDVTPYAKAMRVAARIPRGEVLTYDCSHFEPYLEPHFEAIVTDQIDFLDRHLGGVR